MIGIVVVSHSPALAEAAVALALQMTGDTRPAIAIAAGAGEGVIGTDAVRVADAIDEVASPDGVLVFMDLGSAVLSTTMALEFRASTTEVRLSSAPFVEGIVAGVVLAAAGASLDEAEREASSAMTAKNAQPGSAAPAEAPATQAEVDVAVTAEATIVNDVGLHARPASVIVAKMAGFDAKVTIADADDPGRSASASSLLALMGLGLGKGTRLRISGTGADAAEAVEWLRAITADGYGE
ncbi:dihydroxyacetone kinase phosphoryl donor subunit DhaM [Conyzicola sp.]|uniref:dihydroxyacetone kinase phosphoryl donor subunit DhaM n=1 Tax=Conyzicola sp. TaxID=1969404 RepID=UPI003988C96A